MGKRILIADDHELMRHGLRALLESRPDTEIVGEAADGRTAVALARELLPDIVVMDVAMPDLNGIEATRWIVAEVPRAKVLALSMHSDRRFITEMLRAGASGYLLKDSAFEELVRAIDAVATGQTYLSPAIANLVVESYLEKHDAQTGAAFTVLGRRERETLQLLAEGKTTKQIALTMGVSVKTVETHRQQIMTKLDVHSVAELTKYAVREGITSLEA
jgi:DNA-binding NarL/FixJ family response regulator